MDIEKLIKQFRSEAATFVPNSFAQNMLLVAATALSTLQTEAEGMRANWYKSVEKVKKPRDELEQARAEIARLKYYEDKCHDCPIVCAKTEIIKAHEELEAVQAELEQVKRERKKLERFLGELEGAVYAGQYFHLRPMIEKWRGQKED